MKLKDILKEHAYLGELPSSKLKKMKWNPVLSPNKVVGEKVEVVDELSGPIREEYIEIMRDLDEGLMLIKDGWLDWKNGPMTEKGDIKPAQKELMQYVNSWMKKNIK
mgnify:FL=1